jgi:cytochrome c
MQHKRTNLLMKTPIILLGAIAVMTAIAASSPDAHRGRDAFEKRCTGCHSLDQIKIGPRLRGVYGRPAGKDSQFEYSDALKSATITWDESTLDRWLSDTESVIPGNDMSFRLDDAGERGDIIAYLKQLPSK